MADGDRRLGEGVSMIGLIKLRQHFRMFFLMVLAATVLGTAGSALAWAPDTVMTFQIVRNSDPSCEPTCPEWIYAAGSIETESVAAFRKVLKRLGKRRLPIVLASNGGDRESAQAIGRLIREKGLTVAIGVSYIKCAEKRDVCKARPTAIGIARFDSANCISACPLMFAGGAVRISSDRNIMGIHAGTAVLYSKDGKKFETLKSAKRAKQVLKRAQASIIAYLDDMGVDPTLESKSRDPTVYEVPFDEQLAWRLVTKSIDYDIFTNPETCKKQPLPENCATID